MECRQEQFRFLGIWILFDIDFRVSTYHKGASVGLFILRNLNAFDAWIACTGEIHQNVAEAFCKDRVEWSTVLIGEVVECVGQLTGVASFLVILAVSYPEKG